MAPSHQAPPLPLPLPPRVQGRVVSGHNDALDLVAERAVAGGALRAVRLAVSGAFHTSLMQPASRALQQASVVLGLLPPAACTSLMQPARAGR